MHVCVWMCGHASTMSRVWSSEDNELLLSSLNVDSEDRIEVSLGGKCLAHRAVCPAQGLLLEAMKHGI